jgi:alpha-glucuronidase
VAKTKITYILVVFFVAIGPVSFVQAEDGFDLWLRYHLLDIDARTDISEYATSIVSTPTPGPVTLAATAELQRGLSGLLGREVPLTQKIDDGTIVLGTPANLPVIAGLDLPLAHLGEEGYVVRSVEISGHRTTVIAANGETGLLYGAFEFLRLAQTGARLEALAVTEAPKIGLRLLNHWDNLDRYVERGYAGQSIWDWWRLPDIVDSRYTDYARANASIGINGTVLNNVNASAEVLTPRYIGKAAALANVFRPYGIRVYLSVRFSAPIEIGGLQTADPLDPSVRDWWRAKTREIYTKIPDFGGFLVKANSEGQPGPQNYGRSHADGANMLADALRPFGGVVMWRAFVYSQDDPDDRVKQALKEFKPLDGKFAENVLVQVKNGPLDFQPREPFHPMFGMMPDTQLMMEFQITQEYLGFSTHLVYLGALFEEVLDADTHATKEGATVARVIDGSVSGQKLTGMAGVANIGADRDWTGSPFGQANWYAFGRLAWNPERSSRAIATEWLGMTFTNEPLFVEEALDIMMESREAVVDYMTPLGLAHIMASGAHYGPAPWVENLSRPEWNPVYYHHANASGIGFDRTITGSNAVAQYAGTLAAQFSNLATVPEQYLLWFHRVPWDYRMRSGNTLWQELVAHYDRGVATVEDMRSRWARLEAYVDPERYTKTARLLDIQLREARWWRDACIAYFMQQSGKDLPAGVRPPAETLDYYKSLQFPFAPGN